MGWFQFLADRDAARERASAEAASAGLEDAWGRTTEPDFIEALFARLAAADPAVALDVARIGARGDASRVLLTLGAARVGPLVITRLHTDAAAASWGLLADGVELGRPIHPFLPEHPHRIRALAASSHPADRDRAWSGVTDPGSLPALSFAVRSARHGDLRGAETLRRVVAEIAGYHADRARHAFAGTQDVRWCDVSNDANVELVLDALQQVRVPGVTDGLLGLLRTHHALGALGALAHQADPEAVPALRAYRRSLLGRPEVTVPLRAGADWALCCAGEPVELGAARALRDLRPRRYGWPKREDLEALHAIAGRLFLAAGVELDWVASLVESELHAVRAVGLAASPRPLELWDEVRAEAASDGALFEALDRPGVVWRGNVLAQLTDREGVDEARLGAWCRTYLEARPNPWVEYVDDTGEVASRALRFLERHPALHDGLADTSSAWIRAFALEQGPLERGQALSPRAEGVQITRIDRVPFVVGHELNGVGIRPDGAVLAAVGSNFARLIDARTGEGIRGLALRWNWGYRAEWSPDGRRVAACFHGGHVEVYDPATGARVLELVGHGGVPHGVRSLAWSPDGATLVSGGQDGLLIGWDAHTGAVRWQVAEPGCWQAVAFTPDGQVLASHVKTAGGELNFVVRLDPATGQGDREPTKTSMWALAVRADGLVAMAGEGKGVQLCKPGSFKTWRKLGASDLKRITGLAWGASALHAVGDDGRWLAWDVDGKTAFEVRGPGPALWGVCARGDDAWAVGKDGVVHRAGPKGLLGVGASHRKRIIGIDAGNGPLTTLDWDGGLLTWPPGGGAGAVLADLQLTPESMVRHDDGWLLGTRRGLRRLDRAGAVLAASSERADEIAVRDGVIAHSQSRAVAFADACTLQPCAPPVPVGTDDVNALAVLGEGWLAGNEDGQVTWIVAGARRWELWDHGADRLESGNPHCNVCSIAVRPDGRQFATGATDGVVRVYDVGETPALRWRIACGFGLFNRLAFGPDGRTLAVPASGALAVWDLERGVETLRLSPPDFDGESLSVVAFAGPNALIVGCDSGRLFDVRWT